MEALVGTLAEPPRAVDGKCRYTLPLPASVQAERDTLQQARDRIAAMAKETWPKKEYPPYAFDLDVQLTASGRNRGLDAANDILRSLAGSAAAGASSGAPRATNGWDQAISFGGRLGHIRIDIDRVTTDLEVPREKLAELAARVRDRIPDLPFPIESDYSNGPSDDPCGLLTRADAESVLGPLVVPPYRSAKDGPLAYPNGTSCAYYTAGHHVVVITPRLSGGRSAMAAMRGVGGLVNTILKDGKVDDVRKIEGPWEQAEMDVDGRLAFRKGDRLLEIDNGASTLDDAATVRLATIAFDHLIAAK